MSQSQARNPIRVLALPAYGRRNQNPFQALLYDAVSKYDVEVEEWSYWRAAWRRCDIWHLHHPDTVVFPRATWQATGETIVMRLLLGIARLRGIRVIWTVHDLDSHDGLHPTLEGWFWRYFLPRLDAFITLAKSGVDQARARFPALNAIPAHTVPHGDFRGVYPNTLSKAEARDRLGLPPSAPVLLHFGLIRPYKSVPELIAAFRAAGHDNATLLIAGRVWDPALEDEIRSLAPADSKVTLRLEWIPFEDTELYFNACDLVVLPYRRILNSGTALLALSFNRPVLVPKMGAMREHRDAFGPDWVRLYDGEISGEAISEAIGWSQEPRADNVDWTGLDWDSLGDRTRQVYDDVLKPKPYRGPACPGRNRSPPDMPKLSDVYPPAHLWRYLVQRYFQRTYPETPVVVANASVVLNAWLRPTDQAFEWGSGRSTTWIAPRVGALISIEHDAGWYETVKEKLARRGLSDKVDYRHIPADGGQLEEPRDHPYAHAIDPIPDGSLDFVIVDGQMRLRCAERAVDKLKPMGLLVIDGANRYIPNNFEGGHLTLREYRDTPLNDEWAALLDRLKTWRAIHTTDFLWDTRMWVKPPVE